MADNITVTPGSGASVAAENIGGVLYQRVKVTLGDTTPNDLAFGAAAAAASLPVTQSTEDVARMGSLTETAPASDTASSGLNGRLQRVAQRLSSLIGLLPTALATGGGLKVTVQDTFGAALDYTVPALTEGGLAHDAPVGSGKPVVVGVRGASAQPTAVSADGDVTRAMGDLIGRQVVMPHQIRPLVDSATAVRTASTSLGDLVPATASTFNDIISITLVNTGVATAVEIYDADDTTLRWSGYVPAGDMRGIVFPVVLKQPTVNTKWRWKTLTSTSSVAATVQIVRNI